VRTITDGDAEVEVNAVDGVPRKFYRLRQVE